MKETIYIQYLWSRTSKTFLQFIHLCDEFCDLKVKELENKIIELGPEKVAAFIAEPILASGGVIIPPKGYHRKTQEKTRKSWVFVYTIKSEKITLPLTLPVNCAGYSVVITAESRL